MFPYLHNTPKGENLSSWQGDELGKEKSEKSQNSATGGKTR